MVLFKKNRDHKDMCFIIIKTQRVWSNIFSFVFFRLDFLTKLKFAILTCLVGESLKDEKGRMERTIFPLFSVRNEEGLKGRISRKGQVQCLNALDLSQIQEFPPPRQLDPLKPILLNWMGGKFWIRILSIWKSLHLSISWFRFYFTNLTIYRLSCHLKF